MRTQFWRWLGASVVFAAVPFIVRSLLLWVYDKPTGLLAVLGNGELALAASVLSSSALLDLYFINKEESTGKGAVFLLAGATSFIGVGFYGGTASALPDNISPDRWQVAVVSLIVYALAALSSWFSLRIAEEERDRDRN